MRRREEEKVDEDEDSGANLETTLGQKHPWLEEEEEGLRFPVCL